MARLTKQVAFFVNGLGCGMICDSRPSSKVYIGYSQVSLDSLAFPGSGCCSVLLNELSQGVVAPPIPAHSHKMNHEFLSYLSFLKNIITLCSHTGV